MFNWRRKKKSSQFNWPDNADGDALRRIEADGFCFDKVVTIDFMIDFDDWPLPEETIDAIRSLYPDCRFFDPEEDEESGYVELQVKDKLTYELVTETQDRITEQMKPYGGRCESWGVMVE